jgi:hypothetical protein
LLGREEETHRGVLQMGEFFRIFSPWRFERQLARHKLMAAGPKNLLMAGLPATN